MKGRLDMGPAIRAMRKGAAEGVFDAAQHVLGEAVDVAPIEEGTLVRSGFVSTSSDGLQAAVSFDTPYAVRQHEDQSYRHDAGKTAKYLEGPLVREKATVQRIIHKRIAQALRRLG